MSVTGWKANTNLVCVPGWWRTGKIFFTQTRSYYKTILMIINAESKPNNLNNSNMNTELNETMKLHVVVVKGIMHTSSYNSH